MKVSLSDKGVLTITIQTTKPTASKTKAATGKGMDLIATTGGFVVTDLIVEGKAVRGSLNFGI